MNHPAWSVPPDAEEQMTSLWADLKAYDRRMFWRAREGVIGQARRVAPPGLSHFFPPTSALTTRVMRL